MPELHRQDNAPQLSVARDPGSSPDPRPALLTPDDLRQELITGQVGRALPLLCRIRDARDNQLISSTQADDYLDRLATLVHQETGNHLLERYPDPVELRELFKQDYLGPEAVEQTWGVDIPPHLLPPQSFTDLERQAAQKYGLQLRLRVDQAPDGSPLTIQKMAELRDPILAEAGRRYLVNTSLHKTSDFYLTETPCLGWALTTKGLLSGSTNKDLVKQLDLAIQTLRNILPPDTHFPRQLEEAIQAWDAYLATRFGTLTPAEIRQLLLGADWKTYADELAAQPIVHHLLPSAPDLLFDHETSRAVTTTTLLPSAYASTRSRLADGTFVSLGGVRSSGCNVLGWRPGNSHGSLGLVLSRSR